MTALTAATAAAVSSSPNLHTVRAQGGGETGAARPLAVEHTGPSLLGLAGSRPPSDDLTSASPTSHVGEDGGVLDPSRGTAPGRNPEPADNCAL